MIGVALPNLKISQYPTAVHVISRIKKTMRLMAESLGIFNLNSYALSKVKSGSNCSGGKA